MSKANLATFHADLDGFAKGFLTQDECWVHHFEPETKRQFKQWKHSTSPAPKKVKVVPSAGKMMIFDFWNAQSLVLIHYLQKGKLSLENTMPTC